MIDSLYKWVATDTLSVTPHNFLLIKHALQWLLCMPAGAVVHTVH